MEVIIETKRLLLSTFSTSDAQLIYDLNLDPEVTRYTGDPVMDINHARQILELVILPQYTLYNHGRWAVYTRDNLEFIGWCGLKTRPERNFEIDLGYRFFQHSWGKGFATEAAFASLHYGFQKLKYSRIVGRAMPQNLASIRVLEKCGMAYVGEEIVDDHPAKTYEALNPYL